MKKFLIFLLLAPSFYTSAQNIDSSRIDAIFRQFNRKDCPGCAVAIMNAGKIIFHKGYGMASLEHPTPVSANTLFDVASLTKQFTAFAILLLEKRRALSLDDNVRQYVPELPDFGKPITIRHLIHHTSGLRDFGELLMMTGWRRDSPLNTKDFLDIISRQQHLNYPPGEMFLYNNTNYVLLGLIVEKVSGRTYSEFISSEIFLPLNMNSAIVRSDPWMVVPGIASKYTPQKDGSFKLNFIWSFTKALGATGMLVALEDLAKWDSNFYREIVGGEGVSTRMYTQGRLNSGNYSGHAFGMFVSPYKGLRRYLATGSGGGGSVLMQFPDQRLSVAVLCNRYNIDPIAFAEKLSEVVLEGKFDPKHSASIMPPPSGKPPSIKNLQKHEGIYWLSRSTEKVKFFVDKGVLMEQYNMEKPAPLIFLSDGRFFSKSEDLVYRFEPKKDMVFIETIIAGGTTEWERAEKKKEFISGQTDWHKYAGNYYSNELELTWSIYLKEGKLFISRKKFGEQLLEPLYYDGFYFNYADDLDQLQFKLEFVPLPGGKYQEFQVSIGRLKGVVFRRVE